MTEPTLTWLTPEAHERLTAELEHLRGPGRTEIAKKIEEARLEGDLRENGGYHAAKEEQGKQEARIRQLQELLETAEVGEPPADAAAGIASGMVVTATVAGDQVRFLLGNREVADHTDLDVYSEKSPLGAAIMGRTVGETTSYEAPNGKQVEVKILDAKPYTG